MDKISLSICIPTFNRAKLLESCLLSIYDQLNGFQNLPIEIIISDNCSSDNTLQVIDLFKDKPYFRYYRQEENLGALSGVKLMYEYALGKFIWVVGDDDFIYQGAIIKLLESIEKYGDQVDFIYASHKNFREIEYLNYTGDVFSTSNADFSVLDKSLKISFHNYDELLLPKYSRIFLCEMMSLICKRETICRYQEIYTKLDAEYLSTLETTYLMPVIMANTLVGKKALFIATPIILAFEGARTWWYRVGYIMLVHLRSLLDLYKEKGVDMSIMDVCFRKYISMTFIFFIKYLFDTKAPNREKVSFLSYFKLLCRYPFYTFVILFTTSVEFLKNRLLKIYRYDTK